MTTPASPPTSRPSAHKLTSESHSPPTPQPGRTSKASIYAPADTAIGSPNTLKPTDSTTLGSSDTPTPTVPFPSPSQKPLLNQALTGLASSFAPPPHSQQHSQSPLNSQPLPLINQSVVSGTAAPPQATNRTQLPPPIDLQRDQSSSIPPPGSQANQQPPFLSNQNHHNFHSTAQPSRLPAHQISRTGHSNKGFLRGTMSGTDPGKDKVERALSEEEMRKFSNMTLAELYTIAVNSAKHLWMTEDMKEELDELYYEFQRNLNKLAIKNRTGPHLYWAHIGHARKARAGGGTSWNKFLHYDPEVKKLFADYGKDEGGDRVSKLWAEKPGTSKVLYCDVNFCTGLSESNAKQMDIAQVESHAPTSATQVPRVSSCASAAKVPQKQTLTAMTDWALKTKADFKSFAFFHQVKGFFVLASRHPKSTIFKKGGLPLGKDFLEMIAEKDDAAGHFHTWVAGKAIQILNGVRVNTANRREKAIAAKLPPGESGDVAKDVNLGSVAKNVHAIRVELRDLINVASGNRYRGAWPGTNCRAKLRKLNLKLRVAKNDWKVNARNITQPLKRLHKGPAIGVCACLHTKKITLTVRKDNDSSTEEEEEEEEEEKSGKSEEDKDNCSVDSESNNDDTSNSRNASPSKKRARQNCNANKKSGSSKAATKKKKSKLSSLKKRAYLNRVRKNNKRASNANHADNGNSNTTHANNGTITPNGRNLPPSGTTDGGNSSMAGKDRPAPNQETGVPSIDPLLNTIT
ncbi:hypothetical protein PCASD_00359 [Puccinia coronata f. sp. avenae]|uniref:Uncharacterized protein n=1 Tax=Puccinia coronata f. sp. avenae TaxID=200324 RepID=A0A2N5VN10_9BASI|nr:hypothetical protein PCASD_00359 [Puccinia coronata f. sp. avenae]